MKHKIKLSFLSVLLIIASLIMTAFGFSMSTYAEDDSPVKRLAISPSYESFDTTKPGDILEGEFEIHNLGNTTFEYKISFAPYSVTNEQYDPDFTKETNYTDIKDWITVSKEEGELDAGGQENIKYTINIPEDQHGGAQAGAILITMKNNETSEANAIVASKQLAYIIYTNVDGEITKTGKVLENKIPSFLFKPPISATSIVENTGNVYTAAEYKLQVFPLFSDEEVFTNEETPDSSVVFPETKRFNQISWDGAPQLGIFRVRQTVKIFDDESTVEKLVFLCPIWFLFIVLLIIFMIIFWIVSRIMHRKKEASE